MKGEESRDEFDRDGQLVGQIHEFEVVGGEFRRIENGSVGDEILKEVEVE